MLNFRLYIPGNTVVHRFDARGKLILLLACSISVFLVQSWAGLGLMVAAVVLTILVARLPLRTLALLSIPLMVVLALVWLFNAFTLDVNVARTTQGLADVSAGFASGMPAIALVGSFGFSPEGCMQGLFYVLRILVILYASFVVVFTTTSNALVDAFVSFLRPLRVVRVPVDDVAMVLSIALRFIPLTAEELMKVCSAQAARGARYDEGSLAKRLRTWSTVLVPLLVGLFHRADTLAQAMDARCYGASVRTSLTGVRFSPLQILCTVLGIAVLVAVCVIG